MLFESKEKLCPALFIIFGATGDLTHRKLLPAIYNLNQQKLLPNNFALIAVARRDKTHKEFRKDVLESVKKVLKKFNKKVWAKLSPKIYYYKKDFDEANYSDLKTFLNKLDKKHKTTGNRIFYLATRPNYFGKIITNLKKHKFLGKRSNKKYKIIIEKPFGDDLISAKKLNNQLCSLFEEEEIYRIDHYLGKEAVQNIFAFRFANRIFESVWNSKYIDNIQITAFEKLGIGTRGGYYDIYGALKDMVQNHLLQVLALVTMEPPKSFEPAAIKDEKLKVLKSIKPMTKEFIKKNVVFAQYNGYNKEKGVALNSRTESFVALKLFINNSRWKNTPFYLRTGKNLEKKASEIVINFKKPTLSVFSKKTHPEVLVIRLQPHEGIYLRFNVKKPGNEFNIQSVNMDFCHECLFVFNTPKAYEKLLYDVFTGDSTLFTRWDEVEYSWKIIDPIAKYWSASKNKPKHYKPGSFGPKESNLLIQKDGRSWRN